jgi:nitrogen fixation protein FixH
VSAWMRLAFALVVVGVFGVIGITVFVGSRVREETVVARPYEEGLRQDADRAARAALGLAVSVDDEAPEAGARGVAFRLSDRDGRPVPGARVTIELSRPETSRGGVRAGAVERAPGAYEADVAFPSPGPWDVRFDVERGADRVRLERRFVARAPCDLASAPCTRPLPGGGALTLELFPRPLRTMGALSVRVVFPAALRPAQGERGQAQGERIEAEPAEVTVAFSMVGMEMGENRVRLERRAPFTFEGTAVLVRCPSGRRDWTATVAVARSGDAAREARFPFTVRE